MSLLRHPALSPWIAPYRGIPGQAWALGGVSLVHRAGTMILPFFTLYLVREQGFSPTLAGLGITAYGIGAAGGSFLGGWLTDRLGSRAVQAGSLAGGGVVALVLERMTGPVPILGTVLVFGLVLESFRPANSVAYAEVTPVADLARAYAVRRLSVNLGMSIGPAVGGLLATIDYTWLFFVNAGMCWLAAGLLWTLVRPAEARERGSDGVADRADGSPWRDRRFLLLCLLTAGAYGILFQFFGAYPLALVERHGFTEAGIGGLLAVNTLLIVATELQLVARLRSFRALSVAGWGAALMGVGFGILPLGHGAAWVVFGLLVWTAGEMLATPFLEAEAARRTSGGRRGAYFALFTFAFSVAQIVGPVAGTALYEHVHPAAPWIGCGLAGPLLGLALARLGGGSNRGLDGPTALVPEGSLTNVSSLSGRGLGSRTGPEISSGIVTRRGIRATPDRSRRRR